MPKELINPAALYDGSVFGLSHGVASETLVFVSGQVDWDHSFQVRHASVGDQFKAALDNLRIVLEAAGSSVERLLHVRIYVRGELEDQMATLGPILGAFLGTSRPAVTGIGVASLASRATLVEVEAVARKDM